MRKTMEGLNFGIEWGQKKLADLDFADDLALLCHTQQDAVPFAIFDIRAL